ncbi:hypothetical protein [Umezawaea beigongshangensis]|uniref:hypothetical protein n=1 Tax=Umezawaea beigongshangensis TaxID=2780383 RepID=UPI0018F1FA9C|nr:hypothetical protein [Umezawaea beigongshangensis]
MIRVVETPVATAQAAGLRGTARQAYERFLDALSHEGCAALGYRVTGPEPLPRLCVRHLRGADRVVVAFPGDDTAWVLLVGAHDDADPGRNVYELLYELADVRPRSADRRTKPSCCDDESGAPPITDPAVVDDLVARARALVRRRR